LVVSTSTIIVTAIVVILVAFRVVGFTVVAIGMVADLIVFFLLFDDSSRHGVGA
jgi:hypothetical protein